MQPEQNDYSACDLRQRFLVGLDQFARKQKPRHQAPTNTVVKPSTKNSRSEHDPSPNGIVQSLIRRHLRNRRAAEIAEIRRHQWQHARAQKTNEPGHRHAEIDMCIHHGRALVAHHVQKHTNGRAVCLKRCLTNHHSTQVTPACIGRHGRLPARRNTRQCRNARQFLALKPLKEGTASRRHIRIVISYAGGIKSGNRVTTTGHRYQRTRLRQSRRLIGERERAFAEGLDLERTERPIPQAASCNLREPSPSVSNRLRARHPGSCRQRRPRQVPRL